MKLHLRILLPVAFAAFHFIAVGDMLLTGGENGDGALGLVILDGPLFVLCVHAPSALGRYFCSLTYPGCVIYLLAGTLMYALAGFVIGAVIDRARALLMRHRN
jgi:hypothetical protein